MIRTILGADGDLTTHIVTGEVTSEELLRAGMSLLQENPTRLALWDFTEAEFSAVTTQELVSIFDSLAPYSHHRQGGRSALLFSSTVGFGLGRLSEALAEVRHFPYQIKAFSDRENAMAWLDLPPEQGENGEGQGVA